MKSFFLCCALLTATVPAFAGGLRKADADALNGKRLYVFVRNPAIYQENENDKVQIAFGAPRFGHVLAKGNNEPLAPLADPAEIVGAQLAAGLAATYGAQAVQGPNPDYELHVQTMRWGFSPHQRLVGRYFFRQGASVKLVRSSDRLVVLDTHCYQDTRPHRNAPTLAQLRANQAHWVRIVSQHLAWRCVNELAEDVFDVPLANLAPTPAELVDPLANLNAAPGTSRISPMPVQVRAAQQARAANETKKDAADSDTTPDGPTASEQSPATP